MRVRPSWDQYFLELAEKASTRSEDPDTNLGCVVTGPDHEIRATGYNSLIRGIKATAERLVRPAKYIWMEHCERNAFYNAARTGTALKGCTIYCMVLPCVDCARAIAQVGISELVYSKQRHDAWAAATPRYKEDMEISVQMLLEAGVKIRFID